MLLTEIVAMPSQPEGAEASWQEPSHPGCCPMGDDSPEDDPPFAGGGEAAAVWVLDVWLQGVWLADT